MKSHYKPSLDEHPKWALELKKEPPLSLAKYIETEVYDKLIKSNQDKLDEIILSALESKGHSFINRIEFEEFIKKNCDVVDYVEVQKRIYRVNEVPFLEHNYQIGISIPVKVDGTIKIEADFGTYRIL